MKSIGFYFYISFSEGCGTQRKLGAHLFRTITVTPILHDLIRQGKRTLHSTLNFRYRGDGEGAKNSVAMLKVCEATIFGEEDGEEDLAEGIGCLFESQPLSVLKSNY